ncbi:uncharacterized protein LOC127868334 isoform X2 [Dreissena polymorpha]|uniref:uncharacterized protein LOC127868334 isoform X2 n=1 Tax=Dreissena polymorpha TaxID=45954 RepID=UPI002263F6AE|nr:uncharacterized protein LOC127868334 isoform X2 [Dreissena polymorpha]
MDHLLKPLVWVIRVIRRQPPTKTLAIMIKHPSASHGPPRTRIYTVVQTKPTFWVKQQSSTLIHQAASTAAPTTAAPTTAAPTTAAPTTAAPTTAAPTTAAPTTAAPTTAAPITAAPTTAAPTTAAPTTAAPTTAAITSAAPITAAPTTAAPTTAAPTTAAPTTAAPTTAAPTTAAPTTAAPITAAPTTAAPITAAPTTAAPTTAEPTTAAPTTAAPITSAPTTAAPTTAAPITAAPTTAAPITAAPTTAAPTTAEPTTAAPTTAAPITSAPTTVAHITTVPTTARPTTAASTTVAPVTAAPTTAAPITAAPTSAASATAAPTTTVSTATPSGPIGEINQPTGCGSIVSCIMPRNCTQNCQYSVQWRPSKNNTVVEFEVKRKTSSPDYYMALGFSEDLQMGHDSVAQCVTLNGVPSVHSSYNEAYKYNTNLDVQKTFGVNLLAGDYKNGVLTCKFERKVNVQLAGGSSTRKRRVPSDDGHFFDISNPYFLLIAHGTADNGTIKYHSETPDIYSAEKIDFLGGAKLYDWTTKTPPVPDTQTGINQPTGCGSIVSCIMPRNCTQNCQYSVQWRPSKNNTVVEFEVKRKTSSPNYYMALGFSEDLLMGHDSVAQCVTLNGVPSVHSSYNEAYKYNTNLDVQKTFGVNLLAGDYKNGVLTCKFERKVNVQLAGGSSTRKRRVPSDDGHFFDISNPYFLLIAHGTADNGTIKYHSETPDIYSAEKIDFLGGAKLYDWTTKTPPVPDTQTGINQPTGCGSIVSCIMPRNCTQNCQYSVQWRPSKNNTVVEFEVKRKTSSPDYYMALGFSEDLQMGHDSVAQCVTLNGVPSVHSSYNEAYKYNTNLDVQKTFGVNLLAGDYKNGVLTCKFERKVNVQLAGGSSTRKRRVPSDDGHFFDISNPYFLLIAHGTADNGTIKYHSETPDIYSAEKIDFLGGAKLYDWTTKTPPVPDTQTGEITRPSDCGKVYSCFHDGCKGGNCDFMLTWKETGDDILFSLACKRPQNAYCAIGLSKDENMGDDSVFECVANGDQVTVSSSYNKGRSNSRLEQPQFGLTGVTTSSKDGVITCTFKRKKVAPSTNRRKRRAAERSTTFFDLNDDFTLFYAYGSASEGFLMKHSVTPLVSDQVADFQAIQEIGGTSTKITLIKVHGILMVIAWMLLASFGIFSARFYKDVWPEGFEWCSQKRWFVIHRACMVTVFLLTAASFVVIFVYVKGYAEITGSNFDKSHPIIGIVVMALTLINPIMALFRPHPGTPKRPIFNVAHTLVGVAAHACSITNIFSGTALAASRTPGYVRIILWVYVGWLCVVDLVCFIYGCCTKSAKKARSAYELKTVRDGHESAVAPSQGVKSFKVLVLVVHGFVLLNLSLAVIIIVALGDRDNM